jgi:hypothetical protein
MAKTINPMTLASMKITQIRKALRENEKREKVWLAKNLKDKKTALPTLAADICRLAVAGILTPNICDEISGVWSMTHTIDIAREDLILWRKVGHLSVSHRNFAKTDDEGRNWIDVTLAVENLTAIKIRYRRELPASCKCQIVEQTSTYKTLTCDL